MHRELRLGCSHHDGRGVGLLDWFLTGYRLPVQPYCIQLGQNYPRRNMHGSKDRIPSLRVSELGHRRGPRSHAGSSCLADAARHDNEEAGNNCNVQPWSYVSTYPKSLGILD